MLQRRIHTAAFVCTVVFALFLSGCWTSEETTKNDDLNKTQRQKNGTAQKNQTTKKTLPPSAKTIRQKPPHGFSINADTIEVESGKRISTKTKPAAKPAELKKYYTIQIGGFKDAANAKRAAQLLKKRYSNPTNNFYDSNLKLNRVFIGVFSASADAQLFLNGMKRDYPADYKQAFVWKIEK